jgi:hypothetical protein
MKGRSSLVLLCLSLGATYAPAQTWTVSKSGNLLQADYGTPGSSPEYFVIDLTSSYYRLNTGPGCGWGTSIVLWPCYWSGGALYQGGPVAKDSWSIVGGHLVLQLSGTVGSMSCSATVNVSPPVAHSLSVSVSETISGNPKLDNRPNEAFKPVMLSSMDDSATQWDSYNLLTDAGLNWYPTNGWINNAPSSKTIVVTGGNSSWKINAPTMTVLLDRARPVTGWITQDTNPNDDNVGIWAASSPIQVEHSYSYTVTATSN